ncbi:MAG: protein-glutamate O-methyltransferase CheR [Bacteroidota bacterium]
MLEHDTDELSELISFLKERFGYDFNEYAGSSLNRQVLRIIKSERWGTIPELIKNLDTVPGLIDKFIFDLTVGVTEMFRNPDFWKAIREHVFPLLGQNGRTVRIWHAGCSTGEEVFSMAILLKEAGLYDNCEILASDISKNALENAAEGRFSLRNIDIHSANYKALNVSSSIRDYFTEQFNSGKLKKELLERVRFFSHNLVDDPYPDNINLLVCRNVNIYFKLPLQEKVIGNMEKALKQYGFLALGETENTLPANQRGNFIAVKANIFRKVKADE